MTPRQRDSSPPEDPDRDGAPAADPRTPRQSTAAGLRPDPADDATARRARAADLRERIEQLIAGGAPPMSPREVTNASAAEAARQAAENAADHGRSGPSTAGSPGRRRPRRRPTPDQQ